MKAYYRHTFKVWVDHEEDLSSTISAAALEERKRVVKKAIEKAIQDGIAACGYRCTTETTLNGEFEVTLGPAI